MSYPKATPAQLVERLAIVRERFLLGLHSPEEYNEILKEFQFADDRGTTWAPGANTDQWYRWERSRWIKDTPPAELNLPALPMMFVPVATPEQSKPKQEDEAARDSAKPGRRPSPKRKETDAPAVVSPSHNMDTPVAAHDESNSERVKCAGCGQLTAKGVFCSHCGTSLSPQRRCPKCGAVVPAGKRFCTNDGTPVPD
jgi:hypothetical protein